MRKTKANTKIRKPIHRCDYCNKKIHEDERNISLSIITECAEEDLWNEWTFCLCDHCHYKWYQKGDFSTLKLLKRQKYLRELRSKLENVNGIANRLLVRAKHIIDRRIKWSGRWRIIREE